MELRSQFIVWNNFIWLQNKTIWTHKINFICDSLIKVYLTRYVRSTCINRVSKIRSALCASITLFFDHKYRKPYSSFLKATAVTFNMKYSYIWTVINSNGVAQMDVLKPVLATLLTFHCVMCIVLVIIVVDKVKISERGAFWENWQHTKVYFKFKAHFLQ